MSAYSSRADIGQRDRHVSFGPQADMAPVSRLKNKEAAKYDGDLNG
jgi:hypothetical protein